MSWLLAFLGFAALITLHEAGHFVAAKAVGMRVDKFMLFFGKPIVSFRRGETQYGIGWLPLGGYVKIAGMNPAETLPPGEERRGYFRQPVWKRIVTIAAGPLVNVVLAFVILWGYFGFAQVPDSSVPGPTITFVEPASPAAQAGLRVGDELLAVDGRRGSVEVLRTQIATHRCPGAQRPDCVAAEPARLTVLRDGREVTLTATPRVAADSGRPTIGFGFGRLVDLGGGEAAQASARYMWRVTEVTVETLVGLFYSERARDEIGSVAGGYRATQQAITFDGGDAMRILGLISLSLAIINLAPFLPLDGGHIFWALAEKLRRRPIAFRTMERASIVGIGLVLILFAIGLSNDIERFQDGTFDRR